MLRIWVKSFREDCIRNIDEFFNKHYNKSWLEEDFSRRVLSEIDSTLIQDGHLVNTVYGEVGVEDLSLSCKALLLLNFSENANVYVSNCSNDCSSFILELSKNRDITITLHSLMEFKEDFEGVFLDIGEAFSTKKEYVLGVCKLLGVI